MSLLPKVLERLITIVEHARVLDRPAAVGQKLTGALPAGRVKDLLSGTPIGHPLHPILVTVPVGSFVSSLVLDVTGGDRQASRRLLGLGLVSAVPAAAAGLSDWGDTLGAERRVGVVHALTNTVSLALLASSWWVRRDGRSGLGRSVAGVALLSGSGWLGGHLSYAQGVGVDTTAFQKPPIEWTDACAFDDLAEGKPYAVTVEDTPILLLLRGSRVLALADRCTHRGAPLSDGQVVGDCIECPWHASRFSLETGEVVQGPATRPQPTFEVRLQAGMVQVRRDEQRTLRLNPTS